MMNIPRVTLVVPIYNVAPYLAECIESIKQQSNSDFEVICVEDCSTDKSFDVLKKCVQTDNRFRIIQNAENKGLSYNRNIGIKEAKGEFVSFIDSDDTIPSNYIETLVQLFDLYDVEGISFEDNEFIDGETDFSGRERPSSLTGVMSGAEALNIIMNESAFNVESQFYMWRVDFLRRNNLYFYEGIYHEDNLYFLKTIVRCKRLLFIHDKLYNYRARVGSIGKQGIKLKHVESMLYVCDEVKKEISNLSGTVREDALRYLRFNESMFCYKFIKYAFENNLLNSRNSVAELGITKGCHRDVIDYVLAMLKYNNSYRYIFDNKDIAYIKKYSKIIIYGAGIRARRVLGGLLQKKIDDFIVAVTDNSAGGKLLGNEINQLDQLSVDFENTIIILAVSEKYEEEMRKYAENLGFKHFLNCNN